MPSLVGRFAFLILLSTAKGQYTKETPPSFTAHNLPRLPSGHTLTYLVCSLARCTELVLALHVRVDFSHQAAKRIEYKKKESDQYEEQRMTTWAQKHSYTHHYTYCRTLTGLRHNTKKYSNEKVL